MSSNEIELATTASGDLDLPSMSRAAAASGYFRDAQKVSQAAIKIQAGREMGLSAVTSLRNIHIVEGKIELGSSIIGSLIRRHDRYDYAVPEHTDQACTVEIWRDAHVVGTCRFTMTDAQRAGLVRRGSAWEKYPRNMLFARAISNAARWHAPDVFQGEVYAEGELSGHTDRAPLATPAAEIAVDDIEVGEIVDEPTEPTTDADADDEVGRRKRHVFALCNQLGWDEQARHDRTRAIFGRESLNELSVHELDELIDHLHEQLHENSRDTQPAGESTPDQAATSDTATGVDVVVVKGIRVEPAPGEHVPAKDENERRTLSQLTIIGRIADPARLSVEQIEAIFHGRYGHELTHATKQQVQEFAPWLRQAIANRSQS